MIPSMEDPVYYPDALDVHKLLRYVQAVFQLIHYVLDQRWTQIKHPNGAFYAARSGQLGPRTSMMCGFTFSSRL